MHKLFTALCLLIALLPARADEGMWLPMLLKELNEKDMKTMGMKISAEDIYSINKTSMKDAVVLFGRGCTGELISNEGLLLTNHHCGFGQIQEHSTLEHDYLKDGFWAKERKDELPNPGLTVSFIVRMEDVTERMFQGMPQTDEAAREQHVTKRSQELVAESIAGTHYEALVKSFYNGNAYYLIVMEVFRDVRLVGAPPSSIGNYGRDTDNWSWPRHTGDFSMFRIYAGKDNKPADYSPDNVPFKPRHYFPINANGVKEDDFTMVYGFPARTNEYLHSAAVEQLVNVLNPMKVDLRGQRLAIFDKYMQANRETFIKYADKYSGVSNYHKKWAGETTGLKRANAVEKKRSLERLFEERVNSDTAFRMYAGLLKALDKEYSEMAKIQPEADLYAEGLLTVELFRIANQLRNLAELPSGTWNTAKGIEIRNNAKKAASEFYKEYVVEIDQEILAAMIPAYYEYSREDRVPEGFSGMEPGASEQALTQAVSKLFAESILDNGSEMLAALESGDSTVVQKIKQDPACRLSAFWFDHYRNVLLKELNKVNALLIPMNRSYVRALRQVVPEKKYYPDANQSLRVAFGKVEGYQPNDATHYHWFTTADGILEKQRSGNLDYAIEPRMLELLEKRDYGTYAARDGELHTCFIASNHTTGGNSGSPVLNAKGELIGTNFDRNWQGTMSDVYYDINQVRNIVLDVRYTLWVIDKYAGAGHLLNEMTIIR
jgi:hypothetical protein